MEFYNRPYESFVHPSSQRKTKEAAQPAKKVPDTFSGQRYLTPFQAFSGLDKPASEDAGVRF